MRRLNSSIKVDFVSEKGAEELGRTYFAYVPLENMVCFAIAESFDSDTDINSAKLAVESVLVAFERDPSFKNINQYIQYAHDQLVSNSVKNRLEAAITVVVSDYTRIRYAICGNIKFFILSENAFYLKSETQTYYQFSIREHGYDKADLVENKNLLQYLGKSRRPRPFISKKIDLPEESTMLFATRSIWERVEDVEILDTYEESKPEEFVGKLEELFLLTQIKDLAVKSYSLASVFVEKTFKEDTAKRKKRIRTIMIIGIILLIVAIIGTIIVSLIRAGDRRTMNEIDRLNSEGIRYSNYGNYTMSFEKLDKAQELTGKLKNNWQYGKRKDELKDRTAERWHLFNSIRVGDEFLKDGNYSDAQRVYLEARDAYYDVYRVSDIDSDRGVYKGLIVSEILSKKVALTGQYISYKYYLDLGEMHNIKEQFVNAFDNYTKAQDIAITIGNNESDYALLTDILPKIATVSEKIVKNYETEVTDKIRDLLLDAEKKHEYDTALELATTNLRVFKTLGITNPQAQADIERIENKIKWAKEADDNIKKAKNAMEGSNYKDAVLFFEIAASLYDQMEIENWHDDYVALLKDTGEANNKLRNTQEEQVLEEQVLEEPVLEEPEIIEVP